MTIMRKPHAEELRAAAEVSRLRLELAEARSECVALRAQLEADPCAATWWLQSKVWRQRLALDRLERRNGTLRFALRLMNRLREPVTAQEWKSARDATRQYGPGAKGVYSRLDENVPDGQ